MRRSRRPDRRAEEPDPEWFFETFVLVDALGLHQEQQHQEVLLTDLLHLFSRSPLAPSANLEIDPRPAVRPARWQGHAGGVVQGDHHLDRTALTGPTSGKIARELEEEAAEG